jgi:hypothetical protein
MLLHDVRRGPTWLHHGSKGKERRHPVSSTTPSWFLDLFLYLFFFSAIGKEARDCDTLIFRKFKTCQANTFHLNSDRKILNNLIGYISWHAYFHLPFKPRIEFEYSNQFSKIPDLKSS